MNTHRSGNKRWLHLFLGMMLVLSMTIVAPASVSAQDEDEDDAELQEATAVSVEEIVEDNADEYLGEVVTFVGQVEDVISPRLITVEGDGTSDAVPVAATVDVMPADLGREASVVITGTVMRFEAPPISEATDDEGDEGDDTDIGEEDDTQYIFTGEEIDIDPDALLYEDFHRDPIVVASDVTIIEAGTGETRNVSVPDLLANLDANLGQYISVAAQIDDIVDEYAFTLNVEGTTEELLVVGIGSFPRTLNGDAIVRASGTVETLDLDDEDGWKRGNRLIYLESEVFEEFEGRPVLVADTVRTLVPVLGATTERILDNTDDWTGRQVTLLNDVADVENNQVFSLEGTDGFLGLSETNLTVLASPDMVPADRLTEDAIANVFGTVRTFDDAATDFESLGLDPNDDVFDDLDDDDPVVVAAEVTVLTTDAGASIEDVLNDTDEFEGSTVTLTGTVNEVLNQNAFTLDGSEALFGLIEDNLLVISNTETLPSASLQSDVLIVVTGEVQYLTPEAIDEDSLGVDLNADPLDDREGDPVIVAGAVTVVAVE